jgi:hypothetical protein
MKDTVVGDVTVAGRMFDDPGGGGGGGRFKYVKVECQFEIITTNEMKPHTVRYLVAFSCFLCMVIDSGVARFI